MDEASLRSLLARSVQLDPDDVGIDLRRTIKEEEPTSSASLGWSADPDARTVATSEVEEPDDAVGSPAPSSGYALEGELGRGGMSIVYRARQLDLGRAVAVKRLLPRREGSRRARWSFLREAFVTGRLEHPNVVPVYGLSTGADGQISIAMKLVGGRNWASGLAAEGDRVRSTPDALERHLQILEGVMNAVSFAHSRGVLHRDLKPENVMLGEFGEIIVMDWGLAVRFTDTETGVEAPHRSTVKRIAGTPLYMAPEMAEARGDALGPWTDVYLLGGILHEILTGRPPNAGQRMVDVLLEATADRRRDFPPEVPEELGAICRRALARDPADRFQTVAELRDALRAYRGHRESLAISEHQAARLEKCRQAAGAGVDAASRAALYADLGEVIAGFAQARFLWSDNLAAAAGEADARLLLAETALRMGDLGAAQSALRGVPRAESADLLAQIDAAIAARRRTLATTRRVGLVLLLLQVVMAAALGYWAYRAFVVFNREEVVGIARRLMPIVEVALDVTDPADTGAVRAVVDRVASGRPLRLTVVDPGGVVVADSNYDPTMLGHHLDRPELVEARTEGEGVAIRWSETGQHEELYYAVVQRDAQGQIERYLRLSLPVELVDARLVPLLMVIGAGLLVSLAITLLVTLLLSRHLRRAIERIA